ncbi:hypothetical protein PTT_04594 [Pyrenophora teres f. teres 0-1]|uniref:Tryptophan synthase beta chain-like PALP domain-containing protein n=1 Tax=Pyrenophora teres f. teres (strain 0-1) TaxID=861557 RepID=E3REK2_PYRTT|nr:hypothetical protein PTT_04594 [Pyrenophora teres f. teres 0-1]
MLKREDLQPTFSHELRGAYNKIAHLDPKDTYKGIIAYDTGGHAEGVAFSARLLKISAIIVMSMDTSEFSHS